jgi:hypothetical protein
MAKNKPKDLLLAEIAYRAGRIDALTTEGVVDIADEEAVEAGAARALKQWKEETGGRKSQPSEIEIAHKEWEAAGKPPEGIRRNSGTVYIFKPNGAWDELASFDANIGSYGGKSKTTP